MINKLTILFAPLDGYGHVNACIGVAEILRDRGHSIVFAIERSWEGKLEKNGFREELYGKKVPKNSRPSGEWSDFMVKMAPIMKLGTMDKMVKFNLNSKHLMLNKVKSTHDELTVIVNRIKPDVIIIDHYVSQPSLINSGIPWVRLVSCNILMEIDDERTPPGRSGYSINSDKKLWKEFRELRDDIFYKYWVQTNDWIISVGCAGLPACKSHHISPHLNLYMYPKEIDYTDVRPLPPKWYGFDAFVRTEKTVKNFTIPEELDKIPGKLVYMSMGSWACADLNLMRRLITILAKSPHRFIVSKGPRHEEYELPNNMWGKDMLPQTQVLPLVDLVITHGGNNTVTECFFFGKPMIAMPLFGDQYDNAQRLVDKGVGLRIDPYNCGEEELLNGIESLLSNEKLREDMEKISARIQSSKGIDKAADMIENLVAR